MQCHSPCCGDLEFQLSCWQHDCNVLSQRIHGNSRGVSAGSSRTLSVWL